MNKNERLAFKAYQGAREAFLINSGFISDDVTYLEYIHGFISYRFNSTEVDRAYDKSTKSAVGAIFKPNHRNSHKLMEEFIKLCEAYCVACFQTKDLSDRATLAKIFEVMSTSGWDTFCPLSDSSNISINAKRGVVVISENEYNDGFTEDGAIKDEHITILTLVRTRFDFHRVSNYLSCYGFEVINRGKYSNQAFNQSKFTPVSFSKRSNNELFDDFCFIGKLISEELELSE